MGEIRKSLEWYRIEQKEIHRLETEAKQISLLCRRIQHFKNPLGKDRLICLRGVLDRAVFDKQKNSKKVLKTINSIKDKRVRELFRLRYTEGKRWDDIAGELYFDIDSKSVYKTHEKQLLTMEKR